MVTNVVRLQRRTSDGNSANDEPKAWATADLLWVLGSICQVHRIPFDSSLIRQQFPPPHTLSSFIQAAGELGLEAGEIDANPRNLAELPLPFVALYKAKPPAGEGEVAIPPRPSEREPVGVALVLKLTGDRVLYFPAQSSRSETIEADRFFDEFEHQVILIAPKTPQVTDGEVEHALNKPAFGFRWFIPELLKHKDIWRNVLAASFVLQLVGLTTPLFTQVIIDKVIVHHTRSTLLAVGVGLAMFLVFSTLLTWLRQYLVLHTGNRIDAVLGSQVFRHLLRLPVPYFEHRPTGTVIARLQGIETIREFISGAAITLLLDLPFLFVFLAVMFWYSWQLTLIALGLILAVAVLSIVVTPGLRARVNKQFLLGARNQAFLTEYVGGMETVKSLQMEPYLERRYEDLLATYLAAGFATRQYSNSTNVVATALEQTQTLAILCVGALLVMENPGFTIGMLVAFQMFASRLSQPVLRMVSLWQEFQQANIAVKRLGDLMDAPSEAYTLVPARTSGSAGRIDVFGLSFRYSSHHPYLYRNLTLSMKPAQLSVITGPSGSGKSTLAKLVQGFYPPDDGRIEIDGRDIRSFSANELRQYFGVVPQETMLFSGTVYENLIMASPHARFEDVVEACQMAEIHDVIEKLPQGYQTPIGEHGVGLSGGQKQRLAIARALLKRPRILIFDEATSHLDASTAEQFAKTINRIRGRVTVLFIAHHVPKGLVVDAVLSLARPTMEAKTDE